MERSILTLLVWRWILRTHILEGLIIQKIRQIYGRPNTGASGPAGFLQTRGGIFYDLGSGIGRALVLSLALYVTS